MPQSPDYDKYTKQRAKEVSENVKSEAKFARHRYKESLAEEKSASEVAHGKRPMYLGYGTRPRQWKAVEATEQRKANKEWARKTGRAAKGDYAGSVALRTSRKRARKRGTKH